jgi:hypothetical protein
MHQPVDQGRGQGVVHIEEFAPFPEGSIRGDHDRSNFITGGDNLEQQIGTTLADGQIAQLIEEEMTAKDETFNACALIYRFRVNKTKNKTEFLMRFETKRNRRDENQDQRALPTR